MEMTSQSAHSPAWKIDEFFRSLCRRAKLWSTAACCRFPPRELARGNFDLEQSSPPASSLETKRQLAAALQSFPPNTRTLAEVRFRK
jgi:hypothetical protein